MTTTARHISPYQSAASPVPPDTVRARDRIAVLGRLALMFGPLLGMRTVTAVLDRHDRNHDAQHGDDVRHGNVEERSRRELADILGGS